MRIFLHVFLPQNQSKATPTYTYFYEFEESKSITVSELVSYICRVNHEIVPQYVTVH